MTSSEPDARATFEAKVQSLVGRPILAVDYWDIHNVSSEPTAWDYDDWHHAVMGVELTTDEGQVTVTWTNTFYPYGVEVFEDPIERHLVQGETGPQRIGPDGPSRWKPFMRSPVRHATTWWDRLELGPTTLSSGELSSLRVRSTCRLRFAWTSMQVLSGSWLPFPRRLPWRTCSSPATRSWWSSRPRRSGTWATTTAVHRTANDSARQLSQF